MSSEICILIMNGVGLIAELEFGSFMEIFNQHKLEGDSGEIMHDLGKHFGCKINYPLNIDDSAEYREKWYKSELRRFSLKCMFLSFL